ncbi:MAG: PH domain-containing protein [Candidatus Magasanikbacteria bacterium]|nr:PH domain-containing protein [Candidatus Magasanikbacteria bacterium]
MKELDKVVEADEKVLWEGAPKFWPYFFTGIVPMALFGLLWVGFLLPAFKITSVFKMAGVNAVSSFPSIFSSLNLVLIPFALIGLFFIVGLPVYKLLLYKHLYFAITSKRVIFQTGVIGRDFIYIDFDKVSDAQVIVGFWDKLFKQNSGSIMVSSEGSFGQTRQGQPIYKPYMICNIEAPYEVFKFFKKVSYDVKTDIEYPNQLRPNVNPGYQTDYDSNKK